MNQNELMWQDQINSIQEPYEIPNYFSKPEAVSRHIFEVEPSPAKAFNKDTARANLVRRELNTVKANISLIATLAYTEKKMIDIAESEKEKEEISKQILIETEFYRDEQSGTVVPSRSKNGFGIVLAKTDHRVQSQQLEQFAGEIGEEFGEEKPRGIGEKIRNALPFLKKKEIE
jgi:hypothetical protein